MSSDSRVDNARRHHRSGVAAVGLVSAIALMAFASRVQGLAVQSLWFDEAMSIVLAGNAPLELLALLVTEDIHPPLYPLLLHSWMALAGNGEFSARFLSVLAGVALVPLFYVTGKRLGKVAAIEKPGSLSLLGFAGSLLAASSAFYIGYSQETRNYMLVTLLGLLSSYLLLRAFWSTRRQEWVAYSIATGAALYCNYTAGLLVAFHALFVILSQREGSGVWRRWVRTIGAVMLAYLPWLGFTIEQLSRINDYWPGTLRMGTAVKATFTQLVAGGGADSPSLAAPMILALAMLGIGMMALAFGMRGKARSPHFLFLLLYLLLPSVILFAIAYTRPKFDPRYLLVATPAFYLILAWGMTALLGTVKSRAPYLFRIVLPALGILMLLAVVAVSTVYGEPTRVKADYRSLVSFMESRAQPGDAVVVLMNAPHPYIYYGKSGMPWYPMERVDDFEGAILRLNKLSEHHRRLWFILWQNEWEDPANYVIHAMEDQATEVPLSERFAGLQLRLFEVSPNRGFSIYGSSIQHPIEAVFGGFLEFWGWNSSPATADKQGNWTVEVPSGELLKVDIHWIPQVDLRSDLKMLLTMVDSSRHVWARVDETLGNPLFPPTKWKQEVIHDLHDLKIPAGTPPGEYSLELSLYDPITLKPVDITLASGSAIGAALRLGKVSVVEAIAAEKAQASKEPAFVWQSPAGTLELRNGELGQDVAVPGESVEVTAAWAVARLAAQDFTLRLSLLDEMGGVVREQVLPMAGQYPITKWRDGERVLSKYWLPLPVDLAKGRYWILAEPIPEGQQAGPRLEPAQISHIDVISPKISYEMPQMEHRVSARFSGKAELLGYDLENVRVQPGSVLHLTLYWRTAGSFERGYKVFNHVIDDSNTFAGQRDAVPVGDTRPTTTWRIGEVLTDRYEIPVSQDAKPGTYQLKVGMYAQDGGERLTVTSPDGAALGDSLTLATIEVSP